MCLLCIRVKAEHELLLSEVVPRDLLHIRTNNVELLDLLVNISQALTLILCADMLAEIRLTLKNLRVDRAASLKRRTHALEAWESISDLLTHLSHVDPAIHSTGGANKFVTINFKCHLESLAVIEHCVAAVLVQVR